MNYTLAWLVVGDFNEIIEDSEKVGGNLRNSERMQDFWEC